MSGQELKTASLLQDAFQGEVVEERYRNNQRASKTMARFTVLLFSLFALMVLRCWFLGN